MPARQPRNRAPVIPEDKLQAAIIEWFAWVAPDLVPIAIANGGKRDPREAAKLKRTGTLAGAPDIVVALPSGSALWIETKTEVGRLSAAQGRRACQITHARSVRRCGSVGDRCRRRAAGLRCRNEGGGMTDRLSLPFRRPQETSVIEHGGHGYFVSTGHHRDGSIGEVFVQALKTSSQVEGLARDAAILVSLGIQHGCSVSAMRAAITREEDGSPSSLIGAVLDGIVGGRNG